jgi:tetratricopeptide (TPR) repeat protein
LGVCFQQIKQPRLAMRHYEEAVQEIPDREEDAKKQALYYAGRLALGLKDRDTANKHLTTLAQLDFGYKDVAALLDKVEQLGEDKPEPPASEPEPE